MAGKKSKSKIKKTLEVRESDIHGKGLFATKKIPAGMYLGMCKTKKTKKQGLYTLHTADQGRVDVTCRFKYINHSKKPNVAYYDDLTVETLRKIKPGEELVHDYGDEWD